MKLPIAINYCIKTFILAVGLFVAQAASAAAGTFVNNILNGPVTSTQNQAIAYVDSVKTLAQSTHWPNIKPENFLQNLKNNVTSPLKMYAGKGTNFCGYAALTYLFLQDDPLGYARLLIRLYEDGKAQFGKSYFNPSAPVKLQAGQLKYKGKLDINPAEQMWYLTLADHYKGYLNIFNHNYNPGDEDRFWASVNYAKFNRMARTLLQYKSEAAGADMMRPGIKNLYQYISDRIARSTVVLFINNRIVHKKDHVQIRLGVPTHFVVAESISLQNGLVTLTYWDYGHKTLMQLSEAFLKRIVFGITSFTKPATDEK